MYYLVSSIEYCAHQISVSANPSYKDVYFSVSQFVSLHNSRYCIVQKELRTPHGDSCNIGITTEQLPKADLHSVADCVDMKLQNKRSVNSMIQCLLDYCI